MIWYKNASSDWAIGPLEDIGDDIQNMISNLDNEKQILSKVPNNKWKYYIDGEFKEAEIGDISISFFKGKYSYNGVQSKPPFNQFLM